MTLRQMETAASNQPCSFAAHYIRETQKHSRKVRSGLATIEVASAEGEDGHGSLWTVPVICSWAEGKVAC